MPVRLVEEIHVAAGADEVLRWELLTESSSFVVRRRCPDCDDGEPVLIPPDDGCYIAVLIVHSETCPLFLAALRRRNGGP